jgi:ribosome-binding protein aMBF1 (putative translation factor)
MQVVVKKPHIKIEGEVSKKFQSYLRRAYGKNNVEIIEETFPIEETDWYKDMSAKITPADTVKALRYRDGITRADLAKKISEKTSVVSEIEKGEREVDSAMSEKLGDAFKISPQVFTKVRH